MKYIKYSAAKRRAEIVLCRAEKRNALNPEMVSELIKCFSLAASDETVKVVVLSAEGSVFSAGADLEYIKSLQTNSYEENLMDSSHLKSLFKLIYNFPKSVVAQVEGHAIAGGAGLISVCDFIFCTPDTKIGYSEVRIGFVPAIVAIFLIRKIGEARATKMLLTGDLFEAQTCFDFGLIHEVVDHSNIKNRVDEFVSRLCSLNSGESMRLTKKLIREVQELPLEKALTKAAEINAQARASSDCQKGIKAFLDKNKIEW